MTWSASAAASIASSSLGARDGQSFELPVDQELRCLDPSAVLERGLTQPTTESEIGCALREHVVRRQDQRAWFARVMELATASEPMDEGDPGQHQGRGDREPGHGLSQRHLLGCGERCPWTERPVVEVANRSFSSFDGRAPAAAAMLLGRSSS